MQTRIWDIIMMINLFHVTILISNTYLVWIWEVTNTWLVTFSRSPSLNRSWYNGCTQKGILCFLTRKWVELCYYFLFLSYVQYINTLTPTVTCSSCFTSGNNFSTTSDIIHPLIFSVCRYFFSIYSGHVFFSLNGYHYHYHCLNYQMTSFKHTINWQNYTVSHSSSHFTNRKQLINMCCHLLVQEPGKSRTSLILAPNKTTVSVGN